MWLLSLRPAGAGLQNANQAQRHVALFTISVVLAIIACEWVVYHLVCRPATVSAIIFNIILALALWSYLACSFTDPGTSLSPEWKTWSAESCGADEEGMARVRGWAPGRITKCNRCDRLRPERAHHCTWCGVCVLRMDHHCPWVANCIGFRNHKYFLLLNWWGFWASFVFLWTLRHPSVRETFSRSVRVGAHPYWAPILGTFVSIILMVITGGLFLSAFWMACFNTTTAEASFTGENPYALPSCLDNLRQIFGLLNPLVFIPVPPGGGLSGTDFPVKEASSSSVDTYHGRYRPSQGGSKSGSQRSGSQSGYGATT